MFRIEGFAEFTEPDMYIGEKLEETLKNEGFAVKKEYIIQSPPRLVLRFGVEAKEVAKPESLFSID